MFFGKWRNQEKFNTTVGQRLEVLDNSLQSSFNNVKSDAVHIKQWINYLHQHQDRLNSTVQKVEQRFDNLLTKDEIKYFVDEYYTNLNVLNNTISTLKNDVNTHITTIYSNQQSVFQKLEAFSSSNLRQELKQELRHELLEEMNSFRREIHSSVNSQIEVVQQAVKPSESIFERLDQLNKRLDEMHSSIGAIEQTKPVPRQNLKEKIFKKVTRHSKEYVKSMLISLIKKYNKISGLNLREIVVEEQGIVSKSSFYRLLAEIEEEEGIHVAHEGKEKHYFWLVNQTSQTQ